MKKALTFNRIVDMADALPLVQKETLLEILSKRLIDERRVALKHDIQAAAHEFKAGKTRAVSVVQLMQEISK